jgi:translocation and assembly module TamB
MRKDRVGTAHSELSTEGTAMKGYEQGCIGWAGFICPRCSESAWAQRRAHPWLVLGHGIENDGQQDFALLQIAASSLLSQAESVSVQSQLADALQIDTFELRTGNSQDLATSTVNVGKRISSRTTVSYEQTMDGLSQVVKVVYQLSPKIRLETRASEQSSIDAFFVHEFD